MGKLIEISHLLIEFGVCGTFNLVGSDRVSKYEFAIMICDTFDLDCSSIKKNNIKKAIKNGVIKKRRALLI